VITNCYAVKFSLFWGGRIKNVGQIGARERKVQEVLSLGINDSGIFGGKFEQRKAKKPNTVDSSQTAPGYGVTNQRRHGSRRRPNGDRPPR